MFNTSSLVSQPTGPAPIATQQGGVTVMPQYAALGVGQTTRFRASASGSPQILWLVNGVVGGSSVTGTIDGQGEFTAPAYLEQSANVVITAEVASAPQADYATSVVSLVASGVVTGTTNPQVANYTIDLPAPGAMTIEFGDSTAYGLETSSVPSPANGGDTDVLVAGMRGNTPYHMRSVVTFSDGATFVDADHTFTTGTPPKTSSVQVMAGTGGGPQQGIELFDTLRPAEASQAFATDLKGNVIWTYTYSGSPDDAVQPIKLLPNGHFLVQIAYPSSLAIVQGGLIAKGTLDELREVDLVGNTIRSVTSAQIASALAAEGYSLQISSLHHDVLALPNGHIVLLFSVKKAFNDLPGYPGTTTVLGDLLVDVDQNFKPDWVWNSFDHLDVNRHPYLFPDWTHSNSLLYSTDDHNLLLSVRHQNWVVKIAFDDGTGSGNILWRLGDGGDFQLVGAPEPEGWFYAQHGLSFFTPNTTGAFELGVMDNGDDRDLPSGQVKCPGTGPVGASCYSTAEVLEVNESNMTATVLDRYTTPADGASPSQPVYSFFGGDVSPLSNGDMEVDFCAAPDGSLVQELGGAFGSQSVVWQAVTPGTNQYRSERLPSLYPGVQW